MPMSMALSTWCEKYSGMRYLPQTIVGFAASPVKVHLYAAGKVGDAEHL